MSVFIRVFFMVLILLKQGFQLVRVDGLFELLVFLTDCQYFSESAFHHGPVDVLSSSRILLRSLGLTPPTMVLGSLTDVVEEPENQVAGDAI